MPFGMIPFIKLVFLAFRQVSRPIADAAKNRAKTNPFFKNHICVPPAQAINRLEVRTKLWSRNLPIPLTIPELSEEAAIEVGSKLFGELFIFTIGAALLLWEYVSSTHETSGKRKAEIEEHQLMISILKNANQRIDESAANLRYLDEASTIIDRRWFK